MGKAKPRRPKYDARRWWRYLEVRMVAVGINGVPDLAERLAAELGRKRFGTGTIWHWKSGTQPKNPELLDALATVLRVGVGDILIEVGMFRPERVPQLDDREIREIIKHRVMPPEDRFEFLAEVARLQELRARLIQRVLESGEEVPAREHESSAAAPQAHDD